MADWRKLKKLDKEEKKGIVTTVQNAVKRAVKKTKRTVKTIRKKANVSNLKSLENVSRRIADSEKNPTGVRELYREDADRLKKKIEAAESENDGEDDEN